MTITANVSGRDKLKRKFDRLAMGETAALRKAIAASALEVQTAARSSIQRGGRSGVFVKRGGRLHQRSAPGEPPRTDAGRLVSSIFSKIDGDGLGAEVGTDIIYGRFLEFGTRKMAARPWLFPAWERTRQRRETRLANAARQAAKDAAR